MAETTIRSVWNTLRVGDKDVSLNMLEEYGSGGSGVPVRMKVIGPNGLQTEGAPAAAWLEMLELLGVAPPAPPAIKSASVLPGNEGEDSPEPPCHSREQAALPGPAVIAAEWARAVVPQDIVLQEKDKSPLELARKKQQIEAEQEEAEQDEAEEEKAEEDEVVKDETEEDSQRNRNVVQEAMIKLLNQRVYSDDPPLKITAADVAGIPNLSCTQEAADFIEVIDGNIELINMRADAANRAKKLEYLREANRAKRCSHVKFSGEHCGSPALRGEEYCYFHAQTHAASVDIPVIEDQRSLQLAFARLANQVASNKIDAAHAKVLLQILESAGRNLPVEQLR